jgi:hypothetical protein
MWDTVARDFSSDGSRYPIGGGVPVRGRDFFVDDAVDAASGVSPDEAVGTLDEAFALVGTRYPNMGSRIYVMPDHEETITGVGGIAHDIAGVSVIGVGQYDQRPRFLMDGADTVTYVISAADGYVGNLVFASGHADVVTCIGVTAKGAWIDRCHFQENTTAENFFTEIKATGAANSADGLKVTGCTVYSLDAAALEFIEITDNIEDLVILDNVVLKTGGTASPLLLQAGTKTSLGTNIQRNFLQNAATANDLLIDNGAAANTGIVAHNRCKHKDVTGAHVLIDITGCGLFDNLSVSTDILSGVVIPAIDVDN